MIVAIVYIILVMPVRGFISDEYFLFFGICTFIMIQYFRIALFERRVMWTQPILIKAILCIGNIPFFFFMIKWFLSFITQFEDYNFTGIGVAIKDIYPGLLESKYTYLRAVTFFSGVATLILIIVFELRMIYSVFRYSEALRDKKG